MKNNLLMLPGILCFMVIELQAQIISNGSFESGINTSWSHSVSSGQASFNAESSITRDGSQSLKVVVTQTGSDSLAIRSQNATFSNTSREIYLVRFWARTATNDAELYVEVNGNESDMVHYKIRPHWKLYHLPFNSTASAIDLNFYFQDVETYYIDGVEILDQNSGTIDVEQTFKWNEKYAAGWGWTAGDNDISLKLPDGRTLYVFNDSFYGYNDPTDNEFHNTGARFLRNALVIEESDGLLYSYYSGTQSTTTRFFESVEPSPDPGVDNFYWVGDMIMENGKILVYLVELLNASGGATPTERSYIAQLSYPELELESITRQEDFAYGYEAFFPDGNYLYLYKTETDGTWGRYTHVARCAKGDLLGTAGTWEFHDGSGWSSDPAQSDTVNNVGAEGFVKLGPNNYAQVSMPVLSRDIKISFAQNPEGPWTPAQTVYTIPDDQEYWWYLPNIHGQLPNGKYQISYSVNSWEGWADAWKDKYWYRQRYIQVDLLGLSPYTSSSTGNNLALNKPVTVSSTESASHPGSYAVDDDLGTRWSSQYSDPQWLYVDLQGAYEVSHIKLTWEAAYAKDYEIRISNDGTNWNTIRTIKGNEELVKNHSGLGAVARYIGIYGTARGTIWGYSIEDLKVYGEAMEEIDITDLGGTITAEYNDSPLGEEIDKLIDNSSATKYLTFHNGAWIQYEGISKYVIRSYTLTSANDNPQRDPLSWTLQGSNDGSIWTTIDTRTNEDFPNRFQTRTFDLNSNDQAYAYYRLDMTSNSGSILQLAEWELFGFCADSRISPDASARVASSLNPPIQELEDKPLIYPVPFDEYVKVPVASGSVIRVFDLSGHEYLSVAAGEVSADGYFWLNTRSLAAGVYLIKVHSGSGVSTYKVAKR